MSREKLSNCDVSIVAARKHVEPCQSSRMYSECLPMYPVTHSSPNNIDIESPHRDHTGCWTNLCWRREKGAALNRDASEGSEQWHSLRKFMPAVLKIMLTIWSFVWSFRKYELLAREPHAFTVESGGLARTSAITLTTTSAYHHPMHARIHPSTISAHSLPTTNSDTADRQACHQQTLGGTRCSAPCLFSARDHPLHLRV